MLRRTQFALLVLVLFPALVLVSTRPSTAQDTTAVEVGGIDTSNFPEITLFVSVRDLYTIPVPDLTAEDFEVTVDGSVVSILSVENVTQNELPISVVLVIDSSESMAGGPLENAKAAAQTFLDSLAPGDEVALIDFDSTVRIVQDFTTDLDTVRGAIDTLQAGGRTALYDASYQAADVASRANNPRRFVVLLTDGNEYGQLSLNPAEAGIELAGSQNIPFYVIGLGYEVDPNYLANLADLTRGRSLIYAQADELTALYTYLAIYLRTQYIVTIDPDLEPDGAEHTVQVDVAGGTGTGTFTAPDLYPQGTIEGLPEEAVSEPVTVIAQVSAVRGLGNNTLLLDDAPLEVEFEETAENTAFAQVTLDPYTFDPGTPHTMRLIAEDALGGTREWTVEFTVADLPPVVELSGLDEGSLVKQGTIDVSVEVQQAQQPLQEVIYQIDGQEVATLVEPPYETSVDVLPFGAGSHTFTVILVDPSGETSVTRQFSIDPALFITPTPIPTNTPQPTPTPAPTIERTPTATPDRSATAAARQAAYQTATALSWTDTPAPTNTLPPTNTVTASPVPPRSTPTEAASPTMTPDTSETAAFEVAQAQTSTAAAWTDTPEPTITPSETPVPPTNTPEPSLTFTPIPTPAEEPVSSDTEGTSTVTLVGIGLIVLLFLLVIIWLLAQRRRA